jgi:hypothetical protein
MTKEEHELAFLNELSALLAKYGAELTAEDHYPGYPECGEDVRMEVTAYTKYDSYGNEVRPALSVDLGRLFK